MKRLIKGKKAGYLPFLVDSIAFILVFAVIAVFFGWLLFGNQISGADEFSEKSTSIDAERTLRTLSRTPVIVDIPGEDSRIMTVSELIIRMYGETDKDRKDVMQDLIEKRVEYILTAVYGEDWTFAVTNPDQSKLIPKMGKTLALTGTRIRAVAYFPTPDQKLLKVEMEQIAR